MCGQVREAWEFMLAVYVRTEGVVQATTDKILAYMYTTDNTIKS